MVRNSDWPVTSQEEINKLLTQLKNMYEAQKGKMVDDQWGWCACCGRNQVNVEDGNDTCYDCLEEM